MIKNNNHVNKNKQKSANARSSLVTPEAFPITQAFDSFEYKEQSEPLPFYHDIHTTLYQGDCLQILSALPDASVDAVLTDPPYCSGGATTASRALPPSQKYCKGHYFFPDFLTDGLDQRSWMRWTTVWLQECYRVAKEGAFIACFIDWRQLPALTDCLQLSNWHWKGVAPWDKVQARPQKGKPRGQCEYIVWGAKGKMTIQEGVYLPGIFTYHMVPTSKRYHMTEKPIALLQHLLEATPPECTILDPFIGGGSTAVACAETGRHCIGIELSTPIAEIARERIASHNVLLKENAQGEPI